MMRVPSMTISLVADGVWVGRAELSEAFVLIEAGAAGRAVKVVQEVAEEAVEILAGSPLEGKVVATHVAGPERVER